MKRFGDTIAYRMAKHRSILIAEDEPDTANLLQFHLQRRGYQTTVASDGLNALNLSFERHPDLVILDLMLPKLHGFEVCRMLKTSPSTRHIPVFMLTAMASMENPRRPKVPRISARASRSGLSHLLTATIIGTLAAFA